MASSDVEILGGVGPRLRALRITAGFTLDELSERTGLTPSTLSRLERSHTGPTLGQLLPLGRVYGVPLDDLVAAPPQGDPRVHLRPVRHEGLTFIPLGINHGELQAYKVVYPPVGELAPARLRTHSGREWLYVLSGRITLLRREEQTELAAGEAAEFDTAVPHWIGNARKDIPAEIIAIYGKQGERVHLTEK